MDDESRDDDEDDPLSIIFLRPGDVAGASNAGVWKNAILDQYLALLRNDTRYDHNYYRMRIANCTQAFEWPQTIISRSQYYSKSNNSKIVQNRAKLTMATVCRIWSIEQHHLNDLERHLTRVSVSRYFLTLNISETAKKYAIVVIKCKQETLFKLSNSTIFYDLEWHLTQISRSRYYLTSNNCKMVQSIELYLQCIWSTEQRHFQRP